MCGENRCGNEREEHWVYSVGRFSGFTSRGIEAATDRGEPQGTGQEKFNSITSRKKRSRKREKEVV